MYQFFSVTEQVVVDRAFFIVLKKINSASSCLCRLPFLSLLWSVHSDQCNVGATHSSHSPRTGVAWVCWWTKASGGMFAPPRSQSSHFICHVIMLSCRHVAIDTDCGAVVLVAGRHEGQAVGINLMAGGSVGFGSFLLVLTQLSFSQGLQYLNTDLQYVHKHTHSQWEINDYTQVLHVSIPCMTTHLDTSSRE